MPRSLIKCHNELRSLINQLPNCYSFQGLLFVNCFVDMLHSPPLCSGVQLGILDGRGLIQEKGHTNLIKENAAFEYCFADS